MLSVTLGLVSLNASPAVGQFDTFQQTLADIDAELAAGVADDRMGCLMIAIFERDHFHLEKAYGWSDMERGVMATPETIGRVGSITKSVPTAFSF